MPRSLTQWALTFRESAMGYPDAIEDHPWGESAFKVNKKVFLFMGSCATLFGWTFGVLTILSGRYIAQRRRRMFSMVIAGINCASFPLGTLLGVFTFIVLLRPSVKAMYPA